LSPLVRNCWNLRFEDAGFTQQNRVIQSNGREDKRLQSLYFRRIMKAIRINYSRSLAALGVLILIAFAVAMAQSPMSTSERALTPEEQKIKVTITTTNGFLGPPATRYKAGEQIPVTITMTNTTKDAVYTCISSDVYQDLPKLTRDGKMVPYTNFQSYETANANRNHVCDEENLPEPVLLKPNEPRVADWFLLVNDRTTEDADAWYDALPPGKYELMIQRRLACCDGPMVESNKVSFEVVP